MTAPLALACAAALGASLSGAAHCALMCGGVAAACTAGRSRGGVGRALAFSAGRVTTYALLGAAVGAIGGALDAAGDGFTAARLLFRGLAAAAIALVALDLLGVADARRRAERVGGGPFRWLARHVGALLPARSARAAAGLGLVWGLVPCGLVYGALPFAATAHVDGGALAGALAGALVLVAFGLGTLPALLGVPFVTGRLATSPRAASLRRLAGALSVGLAVVQATAVVRDTVAFATSSGTAACHAARAP